MDLDLRLCGGCVRLATLGGALVLGCRSDGAGIERGNVSAAASAAIDGSAFPPIGIVTGDSPRPAVSPSATTLPTPSAALARTASAPLDDTACGGPPSPKAPLPHAEERKLAASQEGRYRFELKYPILQIDHEKRGEKLNQRLFELLRGLQSRFVQEAGAETGVPDPDNARWFEGKCEIAYQSSSFVSVACDTMEGPGAHPNLDQFAYNFQICPEVHLLALEDVCRALPRCKKELVDLINEDFRRGEKKETGIQFRAHPRSGPGSSPDMEHPVATLQAFGITPAGLRIYLFDELPHVLQAFAVVDLPAAKVRSVLREDVAARLWGP
jgi:hypothetical protein